MNDSDRTIVEASAADRLQLIAESFERLTGEPLAADADHLWALEHAVLAHGTTSPPRFIYANRAALTLFRMPAAQMIGMESHRSAEPGLRAERQAMLGQLERSNIVTGYSGIRIAADGTRFAIEDAVIWNLVDDAGTRHGQAALLRHWQQLQA